MKSEIAATGHPLWRAARGSADIKLRQPLASARVNVGTNEARRDLLELAPQIAEWQTGLAGAERTGIERIPGRLAATM